MAIQKSEAIVLKTRDFRETSLIVNLFTREFGKINGLIKGIRNKPQRYAGIPLIFSLNAVVFYASAQKNFNLVTQCDAQDQFQAIRSDLEKTSYANYFVELLDAVTQNYDKNENLYELTLNVLKALSENRKAEQITRIFEISLLNISGFKPRLDACVCCQKKIIAQGKFSSSLGGIICPQCSYRDTKAKPISKGTLASIKYIEGSNWKKAINLKMSNQVANELKQILIDFLEINLDQEIKSRKFLI